MQETIVPLISSSCAGPLGVLHLPRLWYKVLLFSIGKLPEGYRHGTGGFDEKLLTDLGIDAHAFVAYIGTEQPDYPSLENWVRANAKNLTPQSIAAFNAYVSGREMPEPLLTQRRAELRLDDTTVKQGIMLNNLDDWALAHRQITSNP